MGLRSLGRASGLVVSAITCLFFAGLGVGVFAWTRASPFWGRVMGVLLVASAVIMFLDSLDKLDMLRPGGDRKERARLRRLWTGVNYVYRGFRPKDHP